jgi:hypothetical protein
MLMLMGIYGVFDPLLYIASFIPILGSLIYGSFFIAALCATVIGSVITIVLAQIFYKPLYFILFIVSIITSVYMMRNKQV